jgi:iron(III) transport system ATP-binding protein
VLSDDRVHLPPERRGIGLIFQDFALFPHLTVGQNVAFGVTGSRSEIAERVRTLLARVDLEGYADKSPHMLSGGEQQRVALARAMAPRPAHHADGRAVFRPRQPPARRHPRRDAEPSEGGRDGGDPRHPRTRGGDAHGRPDRLDAAGQIVQQGAPYNVYNAPCDRAAAAFFSDINVVTGTVRGALTTTPFGEFLAPGYPDESVVDIVFRPQHVKIDFDRGGRGPNPTPQDGVPARGVVQRARFMGHESLVEFSMDFDGSMLKATVPGVFLPKPGQTDVADGAPRPVFRVSAPID